MTWANGTGLLVTDLDDDVGIASGSALFNLNAHALGQWHLVSGVHAGAGSSLLDALPEAWRWTVRPWA